MTTWQVQRFTIDSQTAPVIGVEASGGSYSGHAVGVRFDPAQRRQCLRILECPGVFRNIPVATIRQLRVGA